jgi:AcrR family transcriptional regulator
MAVRLSRVERREQTRQELLSAAEACFVSQGFHASSVDQVAERAGYTKGAVYSNFASKEDLFFAVYERRVEQVLEEVVPGLRQAGAERAFDWLATGTIERRDRDDGWLAVFFEFWAHVVRHPELRALPPSTPASSSRWPRGCGSWPRTAGSPCPATSRPARWCWPGTRWRSGLAWSG